MESRASHQQGRHALRLAPVENGLFMAEAIEGCLCHGWIGYDDEQTWAIEPSSFWNFGLLSNGQQKVHESFISVKSRLIQSCHLTRSVMVLLEEGATGKTRHDSHLKCYYDAVAIICLT